MPADVIDAAVAWTTRAYTSRPRLSVPNGCAGPGACKRWVGDTVYFASDRADGTLNLYSVSPQGGEAARITAYTDFDVMWPSAGPTAIVFEKGGSIWRYVPGSEPVEVPIRVTGDLPHARTVHALLDGHRGSPGGSRVASCVCGPT